MIFHSFARSNYFVQLKYRFSPSRCREHVRLSSCRRPPPPLPLPGTLSSASPPFQFNPMFADTTPDQRRTRIFRCPMPNKSTSLFVFATEKTIQGTCSFWKCRKRNQTIMFYSLFAGRFLTFLHPWFAFVPARNFRGSDLWKIPSLCHFVNFAVAFFIFHAVSKW